jgi:hypothetical protein
MTRGSIDFGIISVLIVFKREGSMSPINPYLNNKVVQDPCLLFGRSELFRRIYAVVAASGSISIVGPPRIGKGSLLNCLHFKEMQLRYGGAYIDRLRKRLFAFVDIRNLARKDWYEFFKELNKEIVRQCQEIVDLQGVPIEGSEGFSALLDTIEEQNYFLVLALDSFEKLRENERLSNPLPLFLRSESDRVSYVIASTMQLHEIFPKEPISSPFYNIFPHPEKIGALAPADAEAMVVTPARDAGMPFSDSEVEWILRLAGGHPFILRFVCCKLFNEKESTPTKPIDLDEMEREVSRELLPLFEALWQGIEARERERLRYELQAEGVEEFYGSSLFRQLVKEQTGEVGLTIKDIKEALKKLSKPSDLGRSRLRHLKVIEGYLDNPAQASSSEIGLAIREVLFAAWERLKGIGQRTDTDSAWDSYNIMMYSFFKHHLHNDQIEARLSMSSRTLYRKKNDALNELLVAVLDIEKGAHS